MLLSANLPAFVPTRYSFFPSCSHAGTAHYSSLRPVPPQVPWTPPLSSTQEYLTGNHSPSSTESSPSSRKNIAYMYIHIYS